MIAKKNLKPLIQIEEKEEKPLTVTKKNNVQLFKILKEEPKQEETPQIKQPLLKEEPPQAKQEQPKPKPLKEQKQIYKCVPCDKVFRSYQNLKYHEGSNIHKRYQQDKLTATVSVTPAPIKPTQEHITPKKQTPAPTIPTPTPTPAYTHIDENAILSKLYEKIKNDKERRQFEKEQKAREKEELLRKSKEQKAREKEEKKKIKEKSAYETYIKLMNNPNMQKLINNTLKSNYVEPAKQQPAKQEQPPAKQPAKPPAQPEPTKQEYKEGDINRNTGLQVRKRRKVVGNRIVYYYE